MHSQQNNKKLKKKNQSGKLRNEIWAFLRNVVFVVTILDYLIQLNYVENNKKCIGQKKHALPRLQILLETFCLDKHQNLTKIFRKPLSTKFHQNPQSFPRVVSRAQRQEKKRQLNWRSAPCESAPTFTVTKAVKLNEIVKKKNKNKNLQADAVRQLNMTTKWITTSGHLLITLQSGTFQLV